MVRGADFAVQFNPFYDCEDPEVEAAIRSEAAPYLESGRIQEVKGFKPKPAPTAAPKKKKAKDPYSGIHASTLYKTALEKGYEGSRKRVDIVAFLMGQENQEE